MDSVIPVAKPAINASILNVSKYGQNTSNRHKVLSPVQCAELNS